jgi:4-carboxymuconolactone decarboxylase
MSTLPNAGTPRFGPLPESEMTEEQVKAARELAAGPRGKMSGSGPNIVLLRSPELLSHTQKVGAYLRYQSALPARLNEFAICITARQWGANVEWMAHHPLALKAGLNPAVAEDLRHGRRPAAMQEDEAIIYQFCTELHQTKKVSDPTFNAVKDKFGERAVVELIALTGYYTMLAMVLNVAQQPLAGGVAPPLPELK